MKLGGAGVSGSGRGTPLEHHASLGGLEGPPGARLTMPPGTLDSSRTLWLARFGGLWKWLGAVGAVHPPANRLVAALEAPLVEEVLPYIAEAQLEPKI